MQTLILLFALSTTWQPRSDGVIEGVVVNATRPDAATSGMTVVLRTEVDGQMAIVEETVTGPDGRFRFTDLPVSAEFVYLPGANAGDVHFPGSRLRLEPERPAVSTRIELFDSVTSPCPLVVDEHHIAIEPAPGVLVVRETLQIVNESKTCYVGSLIHEGSMPVTLRLGIPSEFERVTFDTESWGRQFHVINEELVTSLPWPPGRRELSFRYVTADPDAMPTWRRRLSLPCRRLRVSVKSDDLDEIQCNLPRSTAEAHGMASFESNSALLPAGHVIEVQLGARSITWMVMARHAALFLFAGLALTAAFVAYRRPHKSK